MRAIVEKLSQQANAFRKQGLCWLCETPDSLTCGLCPTCFTDLPRRAPANLRPASGADYCRLWLAALNYQAPVDRWLHNFKFAQTPALARHFAILLSAQVMVYYKQHKRLLPEALIAVPLTKKRWRYRGYNQALVLASQVSAVLGIPLIHPVTRHKDNRVQHQLDRQQRLANMRQAFQITSTITCTRVAIVDDIITTGATVSALGAVLSEQGVTEIDAWAVAYTPG